MLGHIGIRVKDFAVSKAFYEKALAPLGYKPLYGQDDMYYGFGVEQPDFWISIAQEGKPVSTSVHVAFNSPDHATVQAFYDAAIAAGGKDNGAPGPRAEYSPTYYGGFVLDPDGNNIEAVCHAGK